MEREGEKDGEEGGGIHDRFYLDIGLFHPLQVSFARDRWLCPLNRVSTNQQKRPRRGERDLEGVIGRSALSTESLSLSCRPLIPAYTSIGLMHWHIGLFHSDTCDEMRSLERRSHSLVHRSHMTRTHT